MGYYLKYQPTEHERQVQRHGYHWTATVNLRPFCSESECSSLPDRLNPHFHNSRNTHLIVNGQLIIQGTGSCPQQIMLNADSVTHNDKEAPVQPGDEYIGKAGPNGCQFVEGHQILSPSTATRFEERFGVLEWREDGSGLTKDEWFERERRNGLRRVAPRRISRAILDQLYRLRFLVPWHGMAK